MLSASGIMICDMPYEILNAIIKQAIQSQRLWAMQPVPVHR